MRRFLVGALTALIAATTLTLVAAPAAQASTLGDIIGDISGIKGYVEMAEKYYGKFEEDVLGHHPTSQLDQFKAALAASQQQIVSQIDAIAAGQVSACADNAVIGFKDIDKLTPDVLQQYAEDTTGCVTLAKNQIAGSTDKAAIDKMGFALNIVGPIALYARADAGFATDVLQQALIVGNQTLMTKLAPTCLITPGPSVDPNVLAALGAVPGVGACYSYAYTGAHVVHDHITLIDTTPAAGVGVNPWPLTGDSVAEHFAGIFTTNYRVDWPAVTDYSMAINQAMAATSYPIAAAAVHQLSPAVNVAGAPVAMAATVNDRTGTQIMAFGVDAAGRLYRSGLAIGVPGATWTAVDGAPELKSVAATTNSRGLIEVFGVDRTGAIFHSWQIGDEFGSWSPWAKMDGILSSIAVARNQNGTLQIFGTTPAGTIFTRNQVLNADYYPSQAPTHAIPARDTWTNWTQMQGILTSISAVTNRDGKIEVYGVSGGNLFQRQQASVNATDPNANWSGWVNLLLPPCVCTSMSETQDTSGEIQIFAGSGNAVYQLTKSPQGVYSNAWYTIPPGSDITGVGAVTTGAYSVILGVSLNGTAYTDVAVGGFVGGWMGWGPIQGVTFRTFS